MAMTMLMILVLSFAFVNMFIMLAIIIFYQVKRDKYATNKGYDFGIEIAAVVPAPILLSISREPPHWMDNL